VSKSNSASGSIPYHDAHPYGPLGPDHATLSWNGPRESSPAVLCEAALHVPAVSQSEMAHASHASCSETAPKVSTMSGGQFSNPDAGEDSAGVLAAAVTVVVAIAAGVGVASIALFLFTASHWNSIASCSIGSEYTAGIKVCGPASLPPPRTARTIAANAARMLRQNSACESR